MFTDIKKEYKIVFVVLVYKNTEVLNDFFNQLTIQDCKVIVVNSYYDDCSLNECHKISVDNEADFIEITNRGYGYGNNIGVKYAMEHYDYKYLILSNSDVIIKDLNNIDYLYEPSAIYATETQMLTGKFQNPDTPWLLPFLFKATHIALKNSWGWLYTLTHIATSLSRKFFFIYSTLVKKDKYRIFSAHGSFIIFTKGAVNSLYPFFDENMFLYNEEWYLGLKARNLMIPIYYCSSLKINHLEGASSNTNKDVVFKYNQQSYNIFYDWIKSLR